MAKARPREELIESARVSYMRLTNTLNTAAKEKREPTMEELQQHVIDIEKCLSLLDADTSILDPSKEKPAEEFDAVIAKVKRIMAAPPEEEEPCLSAS